MREVCSINGAMEVAVNSAQKEVSNKYHDLQFDALTKVQRLKSNSGEAIL